jgi:hypothetical protein
MRFDLDLSFGNTHKRSNWELLYPIVGALVALTVRNVCQKYIFTKIGVLLGLKQIPVKKPPHNPILEKAYSTSKRWKLARVRGLAKQLDMSVEEVQRWVELRGAQDKPSVLTRFCESLWRGCYYGGAWTAAVTIVWDKPWFWDLDQCWTNWDQRGTSDVWWYVMCSWTFYWSELVVLHLNAKKKDFYPTLIHHVTSIILLYFAWNSNLSRIFMVGFVLIDCSDIPLEVSKMTLYLGHDKVSRVAYFTFVFVWIVTRLGYLPFWAVKSYVQDAPRILPFLRDYSFYYIIMILIFALLILNCIWTFFVLKVARDILFTEKPFRDSRSDSSDN